MKKLTLAFIALLASAQALATVDANTHVYLVSQEVQTEEFYVQKVPVIGCYGLPEGPAFAQFTAEYMVPSNIGCGGGMEYKENMNYLTCAVLAYDYDNETDKFPVISLDISKCDQKNNPDLIKTIEKAVKLNFNYSKPKLVIKK